MKIYVITSITRTLITIDFYSELDTTSKTEQPPTFTKPPTSKFFKLLD